ncbi:MAG: YceD family protein [Actinomycetota bacterium]|nr:YceD family protein [Actinomycetota bacterium]MDA3007335.1 YceD family protein [Actinomycetota bacterium]MDA3034460.1 YceD family protein [Actinomycetota bacterium]
MAETSARHPLRVNLIELLRQPGARRTINTSIDRATLADHVALDGHLGAEPSADRVRVIGDIEVTGAVESGTDDVVASLEVCTRWDALCRRCLAPVTDLSVSTVREYFSPEGHSGSSTDDVIVIEGDRLDLEPIVIEYAVLDLPPSPVCRDDCPGLCPGCGAELATTSCNCDTEVRDDRWSALDELRHQLGTDDGAGAGEDSSR